MLYELFQKCKEQVPEVFLDLVVNLILENVFDLFEVKGFKDIGIKEYLKEHMQPILESGKDIIWTKLSTCQFILNLYTIEELLDYFSPTGMVYLSQMLKHGEKYMTNLALSHLQEMFNPEISQQIMRQRLVKLVRPDQNDLTFLDYAFHRKAVQIVAMIEELKKSLWKDTAEKEVDFFIPQLVRVVVELTSKESEIIQNELKTIEAQRDLLILSKDHSNHENLFKEGHGNYLERTGEETMKSLKAINELFKDIAKQLKKEFFRFFKMGDKVSYEYIDKAERFDQMVNTILREESFVTVDVEFCGMEVSGPIPEDENFRHHIACSLQISTVKQNYFVDCLAIKNACKEPVQRLFGSPAIIKVFHGCESDLDAIYRTFGTIVHNIYDTARAAVILHDIENTPGLHSLSQQYLGVHLDKSFQKSIWRVRPLPQPMLEYAITDSYVLLPIFYAQLVEIDAHKRKPLILQEIWHHSNNLPKFIKPTEKHLSFV